jgi:hypothetical protein
MGVVAGTPAGLLDTQLPNDTDIMMPHKFNASRRHKFEKKRQKVTNWRVYNEGLRQRGDVTIWLGSVANFGGRRIHGFG